MLTGPVADDPVQDDAAGGSDAALAPSRFPIRLEQYDGPLDALLELIRKHDLNILDIPIAAITEQYLEALRRAESLDVELSSEFILMVSTLVQIKAKALLPPTPAVDYENAEDSPEDLAQRLAERENFRQAAHMLQQRKVVEDNVWSAYSTERIEQSGEEPQLQVNLFDLVRTFGEVLEQLRNQPVVELEQESVSVADRVRYLEALLAGENEPVSVRDIFFRQRSHRAVVATFLAVLELVKAQAVRLVQKGLFGDILIRRRKQFDEALSKEPPLSDAALEHAR